MDEVARWNFFDVPPIVTVVLLLVVLVGAFYLIRAGRRRIQDRKD